MLPKFLGDARLWAIAAGFGLTSFLIAGTYQSLTKTLESADSLDEAIASSPILPIQVRVPRPPDEELVGLDMSQMSIGGSSVPVQTGVMPNYAADQRSHSDATVASAVADQPSSYVAINTRPLEAGEPNAIEDIAPDNVAVGTDWRFASFPVENFQTYTSPFGYRQSPSGGYSMEFHYGLDLAAPEGSYIRSWWGGTVVEVSDDSNCGTSVVVESGPWLHIYCHMQGHVESDASGRYMIDRAGGLQIWEGQTIVAGDRIGRIGMTGRTTGPHLHWGLKYDDSWVDPALVLRAMYASQRTANR
jgi:murein DD-endopeptidase MepM/ murein hydrolase activator NlpD